MPSPALVLSAFTATLFVSALLLFSVEPMFAKMALPALGGTPAVWAVSMCFFQAALLAGYIYAHALNRLLEPQRAVLAHLVLLAAAFFALPIGLPSIASNPSTGSEYIWLLGVLALGVGLPFFAISANAPLLQAWFSRTGHSQAQDPYFLYGASNFGSLLALMSYPFVVEPRLGLAAQSDAWSVGYVMLAAMVAACGALMLMRRIAQPDSNRDRPDVAVQAPGAPVDWTTRASWLGLAAIPSGLMVAVTTYISTDIASAPFIWVLPLALYLTTFILVFRDKLAFNYEVAQTALPVSILIIVFFPAHSAAALVALVAFLLAALVCHRELYLRRPDATHLTEFYIWMSAGGVVGGIFSALVAPQIFASVIEFKLLLLLALLCRPGVLLGLAGQVRIARVAALGATMTLAFATYKTIVEAAFISAGGLPLYALIAASLGGIYLTRHWPEHRAVLVMAMIIGLFVMPSDTNTIYMERSFFGTTRVMETTDGRYREMLHGTTIHGAEGIATPAMPVVDPEPMTYYHRGNAMPRGLELARQTRRHPERPFTVGVVGLGTGSLACYGEPGDSWRFFEIDPMVARIARNPQLFNFLSRCLPDNDIVIGDARLTLQQEPQGKFDYLLIDAFSSDAIPVHLLTREALAGYFDKLAPGGLLGLHISNRFLDLAPAIAATAATLPGVTGADVYSEPAAPEPEATPSRVIFLSRDQGVIAKTLRWPDAKPLDGAAVQPWTDDYSDVLSALVRRMTASK